MLPPVRSYTHPTHDRTGGQPDHEAEQHIRACPAHLVWMVLLSGMWMALLPAMFRVRQSRTPGGERPKTPLAVPVTMAISGRRSEKSHEGVERLIGIWDSLASRCFSACRSASASSRN